MSNSLLPYNATAQERAMDLSISRVGDVPVPVRQIWNPETCPSAVLPWLAWALSVDQWDSAWSDNLKRQIIASSVYLHRIKGTKAAIEQAIIISGEPNATVEEWFEYGGSPYHFRVIVDVSDEEVPGAVAAKVMAAINEFKNVRSYLDGLSYNLATKGDVPVMSASIQTGEIITVFPV